MITAKGMAFSSLLAESSINPFIFTSFFCSLTYTRFKKEKELPKLYLRQLAMFKMSISSFINQTQNQNPVYVKVAGDRMTDTCSRITCTKAGLRLGSDPQTVFEAEWQKIYTLVSF